MYKQIINTKLDSHNDLFNYILSKTGGEDLCVLGGHYILLYNQQNKQLYPAIWQDTEMGDSTEMSKTLAGDFPVESFKFAMEIRNEKLKKKENAYLTILVNDHFFQSQVTNTILRDHNNIDFGLIKTKYYAEAFIPEVYINQLINENYNSVFCKNTLKKSKYFHPFLFSETSLRNKFDRKLKYELAKKEGFFLNKKDNMKSELFYNNIEGTVSCLTQDGSCGCSGEVIQYVYELFGAKHNSMVLLVPYECFNSVCVGVEAVLNLINSNNIIDEQRNFIIAAGFGDNNYISNIKETAIYLAHYILD